MPIESAVVRSRPVEALTPRKKLPPPTTMPISTPSREAWAMSAASAVNVAPSSPLPTGPAELHRRGHENALGLIDVSPFSSCGPRFDAALSSYKKASARCAAFLSFLSYRIFADADLRFFTRTGIHFARKCFGRACQPVVLPAAATSAAKSCSSFSMPRPARNGQSR